MDGGSVEKLAEDPIGVGSSGPSAQSLGVGHGLEARHDRLEGREHELSLGVSRIVSFRDVLSWEQEDWPDRHTHLRRVGRS